MCSNFTWEISDAFIGYQKDTPAAVIFEATNQLRASCSGVTDNSLPSLPIQHNFFALLSKYHLKHDSESWKSAVRFLCVLFFFDLFLFCFLFFLRKNP